MANTVVIADDITGGNDSGIMYAKNGLKTLVYSYSEGRAEYDNCDVLVVDTDSRFDSYEKAYSKVFNLLEGIDSNGVRQFINKQCSVFRGNIGAEFDAMLDQLQQDFAVVVLGYPKNGRTTVKGQHFVHGVPLHESQFRNDPVHPMHESDLVSILQKQTKRKVDSIHADIYDLGFERLVDELDTKRQTCNYCIMDVRNDEDLKMLASVLKDERIICGSSGISEYLAMQEQKDLTFCVAGSLTPQTVAQTAYMKEQGYGLLELDTRKLLDEKTREMEESRIYDEIISIYSQSSFAMIHSLNSAEGVSETKKMASNLGLTNVEVSSLVSRTLSELSKRITDHLHVKKVIVCGGDTSASVCEKFGINGMEILEEIEPGLPTCRSVKSPYYHLVLKSGSFGSNEFIEKAYRKL